MKQAYRLKVVRTKIAEPTAAMNSPGAVGRRYAYLRKFDRERVIRLDLDNKNRVIGEETVESPRNELSPRRGFTENVPLASVAGTADECQYLVMTDREQWFRIVLGQNQVAKHFSDDAESDSREFPTT